MNNEKKYKLTRMSISTGLVGVDIGLITWLITKDISLLVCELFIVTLVTITTYILERMYE